MTEPGTFRVTRDIPEISAYPPAIVVIDGDTVWVCKKVPPECCEPDTYMDRLTPAWTGTPHLTLMD